MLAQAQDVIQTIRKETGVLTIDVSVSILVSHLEHLIQVVIGQVLAEVLENRPQLDSRDGAAAVLVEDLKRILQLLLVVDLLDGPGHHVEEFYAAGQRRRRF